MEILKLLGSPERVEQRKVKNHFEKQDKHGVYADNIPIIFTGTCLFDKCVTKYRDWITEAHETGVLIHAIHHEDVDEIVRVCHHDVEEQFNVLHDHRLRPCEGPRVLELIDFDLSVKVGQTHNRLFRSK